MEASTIASSNQMVTILGLIIIVIPLASFIILSMVPEKWQKLFSQVSTVLIFAAGLLSCWLLVHVWPDLAYQINVNWFSFANNTSFDAGLLINFESASMLLVVFVIAALVHLYSIKYMEGDEGYKRYFAFLGLFTFSMTGIVIADNLLLIFMFWELVGFSSYLLIGHWFKKDSASLAANKAFIVNRIGDAGFVAGIAILWAQLGTLDLVALGSMMDASELQNDQWISAGRSVDAGWLTVSGICLFMGAMGKSAQFPLQVWLPDAMEGPTPVSALIHAATMVAAGVYLMIRVFAILNLEALTVIAVIGSVTAFMGAVAAMTQHDIKKVLAYSTISQLGYMLMGIGVGAYGAAFFHLFTHAFFKACLFLSAGSVIYALHEFGRNNKQHFDAQDMRNMGGLKKYLPITFTAYLIATLALIGIPFFSGFLSKDALLSGAYAWASIMGGEGFSLYYVVPDLGFITVILTAIYMVRQLLLVFFGKFRLADKFLTKESAVIESPLLIKVSLVLLAALSLGLVWSFNPFDFTASWFLAAIDTPAILSPAFDPGWQQRILAVEMDNHLFISLTSITMIGVGVLAGIFFYRPGSKYVRQYYTRPVALNFFQKLSYYNWYL
ncbi:MAG: NADH-quinone oxidoreductase subunit L, partial [Fulvivirga sp.]|nr:NADH-quinone oxidoreductase subunit L [Fulvivirga sp.]